MGISKNLGYDVTFYVLNATNNKVISRSNVSPAGELTSPNLRIDPLTAPEAVTSRHLPSAHLEDEDEAHGEELLRP